MSNINMFDDILDNIDEIDTLDEQEHQLTGNITYSIDDDFDNERLSDERVWKSYVEDIDGEDNFADYCNYFFKMLEEEGYFDN